MVRKSLQPQGMMKAAGSKIAGSIFFIRHTNSL